jgi:hypothetical protein
MEIRGFSFQMLTSLLVVATWNSPVFAATELIACGMVVKGAVTLPADLDCSAEPLPSVDFSASGSLGLNGHTLIGEVRATAGLLTIHGPGTITGPGYGVYNVGDKYSSKVNVFGADIVANEESGVVAVGDAFRSPAGAMIMDSSVSGNGGAGVVVSSGQRLPYSIPRSPIKLVRSTADGNGGCGLVAAHVTVKDSSVSSNGDCGLRLFSHYQKSVRAQRAHLDGNASAAIACDGTWGSGRFTVSDTTMIGNNAAGIRWNAYHFENLYNSRLTLKRTVIQGSDYGVLATLDRVRVASGEISGNRLVGISYVQLTGKSLSLSDTSLSGNGTSVDCGTNAVCADLDTDLAPSVGSGSTCETSHVYGSGNPGSSWGTCGLD